MRNLHIWLLVACLIGGGAFVACKSEQETPNPTATQGGGATQTSDTPSPSDRGDASEELRDLAGRLANKDVQATYRLSTTYDGESAEQVFTLYWRPPDTWRLDFLKPGEHSSFISEAGTGYWCSTDDGVGSCLPSPVGLGVPMPFAELFTNPESRSSFIDAQLAGWTSNGPAVRSPARMQPASRRPATSRSIAEPSSTASVATASSYL